MENSQLPTPTSDTKKIASRLSLLLLGVLWGSTFVVVSSTKDFFQPAFLIALRFSIGFIFLLLFFFRRCMLCNAQYVIAGSLVGLTTFFGYYTQAYAMTVLDGAPGRVAFLVATYCVTVPFMSWLINKKRPSIFNIVAAFMCIVGIGFISLPDLLAKNSSNVFTDLFALLSSFIFVFHIVLVERIAIRLDTVLFTMSQFFVVAVCAFCFSFIFENNSMTVWSNTSVFTLLYLAIPCTAIALVLQTFGQKYTPASTASLFFALESVFGMGFSVLFGKEKITIPLVCGGFLIVASIIVSEIKLPLKSVRSQ